MESNLKNSGLKITKKRNLVFKILEQENFPVTAEIIYNKVLGCGEKINLSTVYRILEILTSKGIVLKSNSIDENKSLYKLNNKDHSHYLICTNCKKNVVLKNCFLSEMESSIEKETGFLILGHVIEIYGKCPECKFK